jgi:hypothetical protein
MDTAARFSPPRTDKRVGVCFTEVLLFLVITIDLAFLNPPPFAGHPVATMQPVNDVFLQNAMMQLPLVRKSQENRLAFA